MIIYHIGKGAGIKPVNGPKYFFGFPGGNMVIGKCINSTVEGNALLNPFGIIKFFSAFYKIAEKVTGQNCRVVKRKICVGEIIDNNILPQITLFVACRTDGDY